MSNLIPQHPSGPGGLLPSRERTLSRPATRALRRAEESALVASAQLLATEFVADVAMDAVARTAATEVYYSAQFPGFEHRFRAIGEAQAMSAVREVRDMGRS